MNDFERVKETLANLLIESIDSGDYSKLPSLEQSQNLFNSIELLRAVEDGSFPKDDVGNIDLMSMMDQVVGFNDGEGVGGGTTNDDGVKLINVDAGYSDLFLEALNMSDRFPAVNDSDWIVMSDNGVEKIFPCKPILYNVSFNELKEAGVVDGSKVVHMNGSDYKVRLFSGASKDDILVDGTVAWSVKSSEWNRLIYPIHDGDGVPLDIVDHELFASLSLFNNYDLAMGPELETVTWCSEADVEKGRAVVRGGLGPHILIRERLDDSDPRIGWRPLLEKITPDKD